MGLQWPFLEGGSWKIKQVLFQFRTEISWMEDCSSFCILTHETRIDIIQQSTYFSSCWLFFAKRQLCQLCHNCMPFGPIFSDLMFSYRFSYLPSLARRVDHAMAILSKPKTALVARPLKGHLNQKAFGRVPLSAFHTWTIQIHAVCLAWNMINVVLLN